MMLVCVVFMMVNIMRDIQHFQPPPQPPPPQPQEYPTFEPVIPYELPPLQEEIAWLNGRPIQAQIPSDEEETPWNKQNNNVMLGDDTHTQKEAADVLAQTLGKKQLDPLPILGTNQPTLPAENLSLEPEEEESSSEEEEDCIPMVSSMQEDDDV